MITNDNREMTEEEYLRIQHKVCGNKKRYTARMARDKAVAIRALDGVPMDAYRCPFGSPNHKDEHWHVGHTPMSMVGIERLALALRYKVTRPS